MIIAQLSDTHVCAEGAKAYERVATNDMLAAAVDHLNALVPRPQVVIATGDLCHSGAKEEYAALRSLFTPLAMPVFLIPGNHDDRSELVSAFPEHDYLPQDGGFLHYVVEGYPLRLIALDTVIPGEAGGRMCKDRLTWLAERLAEGGGRPTLVFMHHPPFLTGIGHMDEIGLEGAEEFGRIVLRHPEIERIVSGHLHRPIQMRWRGTLASTAPSTAHQVVLDLGPCAAGFYNLEPPACQIHLFDPDQGVVSHTSYIGSFAGPYRFPD